MFARVSQNQAVMRGGHKWPEMPLNPNLNTRWLIRAGLVLMAGFLLALVLDKLADPATLPIHKIRVQGALVQVNEAMLRNTVLGKVQGGYFNIDVDLIRHAVETLPWVKSAAVRRVWPDTISIRVVEQQPLAYWADGGLVTTEGVLFYPETTSYPSGLLKFSAPKGLEHVITGQYRAMSAQLAPLELRITRLQLDARHAVRLWLDNGIELVLGREQQTARLQRFVKVYKKSLAAYAAQIKRIDLRYSHGMAVQWNHDAKTTKKTSRGG
ncbi:MAG: cell division protein FtsQ/DivIB [Proteobacteria bacterium]|jgi:cell division protein FtsQ|nr:cell division protein FtsQ/DivIB [Pseudomonadota bacterium]MCG6934554.1 cell division protein FtsQ/DivIB [Pseudomonadota bacterium]